MKQKITDFINDFTNGIGDLLYPLKCAICGTLEKEAICDECMNSIDFIHPPFCSICGMPGTSTICDSCMKVNLNIKKARAVGEYKGVLAKAIRKFKYHQVLTLEKPLGLILASFLQRDTTLDYKNIDIITPVPIHIKRECDRGYNQSKLLAQIVSDVMKVPMNEALLLRTKNTRPQVGLSHDERRENVRGAFDVAKKDEIQNKNILLIDDVMTTGSTLSACANTLIESGSGEIFALVLAREYLTD